MAVAPDDGASSPDAPTALSMAAPLALAMFSAGCAVASEPATRALLTIGAPGDRSLTAPPGWSLAGPVVAGALLARAVTLIFSRPPASRAEAPAWAGAAVLLGLLAAADRVGLLDAQLLVLGVLALVWLSTDLRRAHSPAPSRTLAPLAVLALGMISAAGAVVIGITTSAPPKWIGVALGIGSLLACAVSPRDAGRAALLGVALGVGAAGVARVASLAILAAKEARSTGAGLWFIEAGESLASGAYLSGFSALAPEAAASAAAAGCVAVSATHRPTRSGTAGFVLLLAAIALVVRWTVGILG
ncbi:MAG TPA: hypothetical protein DEB06_08255 [Phycisphaerales bacterium]|nr:hypothetical protein [Phycisphaerales bacterium]